MKGIVCAGGTGSRLGDLTKVTNKHLLPIYKYPMIYYPLMTLRFSGIDDIMIITGKEHAGQFIELLGSEYTYRVQSQPNGIAGALKLAKSWVNNESCAVILGDNIFQDTFRNVVKDHNDTCHLFIKSVDNPQAYGVYSTLSNKIIEKPKDPDSNNAVTGFYIYPPKVWEYLDDICISPRGEYEITDVNNMFLLSGNCKVHTLSSLWLDAGTYDTLLHASNVMKKWKE